MKKLLALFLALVMLVSVLAACAPTVNEPDDDDETVATQPTNDDDDEPTEDPAPTEDPTEDPDPTEDTDPTEPGPDDPIVVPSGYVDRWFIDGDLGNDSLCINGDGTWEMRNHQDADGNGGHVYIGGEYELGEYDDLFLYENGQEVANVKLSQGDILVMLPTAAFEDLFASDELQLFREEESVRVDQGGENIYMGYWEYDNGNVLRIDEADWYLYSGTGELIASGPFTMDVEDECGYLMNEDGSSGGGKVYYDENGELTDLGAPLTWLSEFPFGGGENQGVG